ncbi:MAG: hypothetical protein ACKVS6_02930 [Planctomycetota bacterium]
MLQPTLANKLRSGAGRRSRTFIIILIIGALAPACHWNSKWGNDGALFVGRSGFIATYDVPGPDPTKTNGIDTNIPALTEENVVEITRVSGVVGVRPAGARGVQNLEYYRANIQTGPRGIILTNPNASARIAFADESVVVIHHTGMARLGDPAQNEPWISCDRLTTLELVIPAEGKFNLIELPGGARIVTAPNTNLKISLERDRYYQIRNQGRATVELQVGGHSTYIKTADWMDLPVVRNAPLPAEAAANDNINKTQIGDATFSTSQVEYFPFLDPRIRQTRAAAAPGGSSVKTNTENR